MRSKSFLLVVLGVFAGTVLTTGIAVAVHDATTLHGCAAKKGGALRLVSDAGACDSEKEFVVEWNKEGVPGAQGETGPQGPEGPQGPQGPQGPEAAQIRAFAKTDSCCGNENPEPTEATLFGAQGVTSVVKEDTGMYVVTIDPAMLPEGHLGNCVPVATAGSRDAALPLAGEISVGRPNGIPPNELLVLFRDSGGAPKNLFTGGGSNGFSIVVFC